MDVLDALAAGRDPKVGSQSGRQGSAPEGGPQTLLERPAQPGGEAG